MEREWIDLKNKQHGIMGNHQHMYQQSHLRVILSQATEISCRIFDNIIPSHHTCASGIIR